MKDKPVHKIPTKGKFSQEVRFKEAKMYCQGTGESVFTGPASYDPIQNFIHMNKKPCLVVMKKDTMLQGIEGKKQSYGHIGANLKYMPGWVPSYSEHRKMLEEANIGNCLISATQGLTEKQLGIACQNIRKSRIAAYRQGMQEFNTVRQALSESRKPEELISDQIRNSSNSKSPSKQRYMLFVKKQQ